MRNKFSGEECLETQNPFLPVSSVRTASAKVRVSLTFVPGIAISVYAEFPAMFAVDAMICEIFLCIELVEAFRAEPGVAQVSAVSTTCCCQLDKRLPSEERMTDNNSTIDLNRL